MIFECGPFQRSIPCRRGWSARIHSWIDETRGFFTNGRVVATFLPSFAAPSGGQVVELPDLPVEDPCGNEAAEGADASGSRAGGVAQLRLRIGGCRDDRIGDRGRVIAV